jgi:hypothetical protein
MPPFRSKYTQVALVGLVREAAMRLHPGDPTRLKQQEFDAVRAELGAGDAPTARAIAQRLQRPWGQITDIASRPPAEHARRLGTAQSDRGRTGLSLEQVLIRIRQAAAYLQVDELDRSDYMRAAKALARRDPSFPSIAQLEEVFRLQQGMTWAQVCAEAGLKAAGPRAHPALGIDELLATFIARVGAAPQFSTHLALWAKAAGISISVYNKQAFDDALSKARAAGVLDGADGSYVLQDLLERTQAEQAAQPQAAAGAPAPVRRKVGFWNKERCLDGMAMAYAHLRPGENLTRKVLKRIAKERRGREPIPSYNQVAQQLKQHPDESWADWVAESERRARSRASR